MMVQWFYDNPCLVDSNSQGHKEFITWKEATLILLYDSFCYVEGIGSHWVLAIPSSGDGQAHSKLPI